MSMVQDVLDSLISGAWTKDEDPRKVESGIKAHVPAHELPQRKRKTTKGRSRKNKANVKKKRKARTSPEQQEHDALVLSFFQAHPGKAVHDVTAHYPNLDIRDIRKAMKRLIFHKKLRSVPVPGQRFRHFYAR
jgi:hypothetical protein